MTYFFFKFQFMSLLLYADTRGKRLARRHSRFAVFYQSSPAAARVFLAMGVMVPY